MVSIAFHLISFPFLFFPAAIQKTLFFSSLKNHVDSDEEFMQWLTETQWLLLFSQYICVSLVHHDLRKHFVSHRVRALMKERLFQGQMHLCVGYVSAAVWSVGWSSSVQTVRDEQVFCSTAKIIPHSQFCYLLHTGPTQLNVSVAQRIAEGRHTLAYTSLSRSIHIPGIIRMI